MSTVTEQQEQRDWRNEPWARVMSALIAPVLARLPDRRGCQVAAVPGAVAVDLDRARLVEDAVAATAGRSGGDVGRWTCLGPAGPGQPAPTIAMSTLSDARLTRHVKP